MIGGLFGQPYLVREMNKKKLDLKADKTEITRIESDLESKATYKYVDDKINNVDDKLEDMKDDFNYLRDKSDKILETLIEMQK